MVHVEMHGICDWMVYVYGEIGLQMTKNGRKLMQNQAKTKWIIDLMMNLDLMHRDKY